ncbi:MAG: FliH/SctL family protein [Pyrinomonadaceae bacterium]
MSTNQIIKRPLADERSSSSPSDPFAAGGVVIKRSVADARVAARRILTEAEGEAIRVRAAADGEARALRAAAYREGKEKALAELNLYVLEARALRDQALAQAEHDLLRLAVKIAEKIIAREIERDAAVTTEMIAAAITQARHFKRGEELTLRVHPADLAGVQARGDQLNPAGRFAGINVVADPLVARGGCVIETERMTIDAQLDTQLRSIERALLEIALKKTRPCTGLAGSCS